MVITIDTAFVQAFASAVRHLAQQGDARLRPHVYEVPLTGEQYNFDRAAETAAVLKSGSRVATPVTDVPWTRRAANPSTYQWADTIEHSDKVQMLIDPESTYVQNGAMAMRRQIDDLLITAATADASDGDGGTVTFPASQRVGTGATNLTLDLITQVNEKFQENDVDPDEPKVFVISPTEVRALLNDPTITSADYLTVKALSANGMVPNFLGFTWILSNRLQVATTNRSCLAFTRRAIGLAVNQDTFVRIAERADLSHLIQVYMEWTMGAVRVEDEHIVECLTNETIV